jgi:hypothetical protein
MKHIQQVLVRTPWLYWLKLRVKYELQLKRSLQRQLRSINAHPPKSRISKKILLPLIEDSHYQCYQMFILAKALQIRGADVKILLCGSMLDGCEIKNINTTHIKDKCLECRFNDKYVTPFYGLDFSRLSDYLSPEEIRSFGEIAASITSNYPFRYLYKGIDIIPMTNASVTRYYYGALPPEPEKIKFIREQHLVTAMIGIEVAEKIDKLISPDIILNNMFVYSVWEPYYKYFAKNKHTELFSVSITGADYHSVILNIYDNFMSSDRFHRYVEFRGNNRLTASEKLTLDNLLNSRFNGEIDMFKDMNYFKANNTAQIPFSIDPAKRNIFLFSNVFWDMGLEETVDIFDDVITWVIQTIEILKNRQDIHLYIKPHPAEKFDSVPSLKGIADFIYEGYPNLFENVTLILPELQINPYHLFPYIDLGLVYNGTLGLEMLLKDIPIMISGKAPYGRLGFAHEPQNVNEYQKILLGEVPSIIPNKHEVELFAYYYLIKTLIPWNLTKRAYGDDFKGYTFNSLEDITPGKNKYLDHICNCILESKNNVIDGWC